MKTMTGVARAALLALTAAAALLLLGCTPIALRTDVEHLVRGARIERIIAVSAGDYHTLILEEDGTVWATGSNTYGQLGTGDWEDRLDFVPVFYSAVAIEAAPFASFALTSNGDLWACGSNTSGEIGAGDFTDHSNFLKVLEGVRKVAGGWWHSLAVKADGSLWSTGRGDAAGRGTDGERFNTFSIVTTVSDVSAVSCGRDHSLILESDGDLWATGYDTEGALGHGGASVTAFTNIMSSIRMIGAGYQNSMAVSNDGTFFRTGENDYGQLGMGPGDETPRFMFECPTPGAVADVAFVEGGWYHSVVRKSDGTVWVAGGYTEEPLGLGPLPDLATYPVDVFTPVTDLGSSCAAVSAAGDQTIVLKNDGTVWVAGYNDNGELGTGDYTDHNRFTQVIP